ncbi:hypothetical protein GCM10010252_55170 [Streptomyces aureoverticillatus]|nr:hypothetical protein GCM10010252_55170 [Streptomyces aureoverticillatus]
MTSGFAATERTRRGCPILFGGEAARAERHIRCLRPSGSVITDAGSVRNYTALMGNWRPGDAAHTRPAPRVHEIYTHSPRLLPEDELPR